MLERGPTTKKSGRASWKSFCCRGKCIIFATLRVVPWLKDAGDRLQRGSLGTDWSSGSMIQRVCIQSYERILYYIYNMYDVMCIYI